MRPKRIVVGITGASGAIYGIRLLEVLRGKAQTHVIVSRQGELTVRQETIYTVDAVRALGTFAHDNEDLSAPPASGSFPIDAMVVAPCTVRSLSAIAYSQADTLLVRAADVALKERRKLILAVRESPLHWGHLDTMRRVSAMGAVVFPPVPAFYHNPRTIADLVDFTVGRMLDMIGIDHDLCPRWGEREAMRPTEQREGVVA